MRTVALAPLLLLALLSGCRAGDDARPANEPKSDAEERGPDRIAAPIPLDDLSLSTVPGSAHPLALPENDLGRVDAAMALPALALYFRESPAQRRALDRRLADVQDPTSPLFRKWLSPAEFGEQFGLSPRDLDAALEWLRVQGFTVRRVSNSRTRIFFSGTVQEAERAFHTELHRYSGNGELHFANATPLSVPRILQSVLLHVGGLTDFVEREAPLSSALASSPDYTSPGGSHYIAPGDLATLYGAAPLGGVVPRLDGAGVSVAVVGATDFVLENNLAAFRAVSALPAATFNQYLVPGSGPGYDGGSNEKYIDVEWVGALAPAAVINYVYSGGASGFGALDTLEYAADNPASVGNPTVISASYTGCETSEGASRAYAMQAIIQQASAEGITVVAAAGDSGAAGCDAHGDDTHVLADGGLRVAIPASIPEVAAVGGTRFSEGSGTFWSNTNDAGSSSAESYIPEEVWNDSGDGGISSGGGGASALFTKPAWQGATAADGARDVPDVAFSASADHDGYLLCYPDLTTTPPTQYCASGGWGDSAHEFHSFGGTSVAAPVFAGMIALLNQALGTGLGNVNPTLYQLAQTNPAAFHDVVSGNNIVACAPTSAGCGCPSGTPGCDAGSPDQYGYSAGPGYDLASGLGSVDLYDLWAAWPTQTTVILIAAHERIDAGTSDTLTATVATSRIGPPIQGDSVSFSSGGTQLGSAVALATDAGVASAVATFAFTPSTPGTAQLTATFIGDGTYLTSSSNEVDVVVAGSASVDAGPDGGAIDAGMSDAGVLDAGMIDGGAADGGALDAGVLDAGMHDGGAVDSGSADAGSAHEEAASGGCGSTGPQSATMLLGLLASALLRRKRRRGLSQ